MVAPQQEVGEGAPGRRAPACPAPAPACRCSWSSPMRAARPRAAPGAARSRRPARPAGRAACRRPSAPAPGRRRSAGRSRSIMPGSGLRQSQASSGVCGQKNTASMRPPCAASSWFICACTALTAAMSNMPRPMPDWLVATTTCQPAWLQPRHRLQRAGHGTHSSGDLTWSSRYSLRMPSRPRMTSLSGSVAWRRPQRWRGSGRPARGQVGDAVHRRMQLRQQRQAVGAQRRVLGIDHHAVEEGVDRRLQRGQRLQRARCSRRARRRRRPPARPPPARRAAPPRRARPAARRRTAAGTAPSALLQDVADALVGRGQRRPPRAARRRRAPPPAARGSSAQRSGRSASTASTSCAL